ncbi:MAG: Skp family chaperone for outer membrane protein [Verrucomicrobiales bacterium]|jgi:Skp family chaperone for outer membrane proteins
MKRFSIFLLSWAFAATAFGQQIAVVDMTAVFKAHPETAKAEAAIAAKRSEARGVFKSKSGELKEVLADHQGVTTKLIAAGSNASTELKKQAEQLLDQAMKLEKEVATLKTTNERDLEQSFLAERRRILALITAEIGKLNASGEFLLILDKSAASANGIPQVLNANGAVDLTAKLIAIVEAKE